MVNSLFYSPTSLYAFSSGFLSSWHQSIYISIKHRKLTRIISFLLLILLAQTTMQRSAYAITFDEMSEEEQKKASQEWQVLKVTGNAIPWETFAKTKEHEIKKTFPDGSYAFYVTPIFSSDITPFKDQQVTIMGYMFPLEAGDEQKDFLIGPYPVSCPYHYHTPPSMIIEVLAQDGVTLSYEPITLTGTLSLDYNEETGVFYFLKDAKLVK